MLTLTRLGDAVPAPLPPAGDRPLTGVRVLDLTRVVAGPVCGRALAAHGAEVLNISAAHLPSWEPVVIDTGRGKRSAFLDLRASADRQTLQDLLDTTDILLQAYRPGALAALGFGPSAVAARRPGIVYVSLSAYGHSGPWAERRGFDSIVQAASGLNHAEAGAAGTEVPQPLPCQALDHASGYLMALGALAGLVRRATEGGSWWVQVSLARTSQWLRAQGQLADGLACADPALEDVDTIRRVVNPFPEPEAAFAVRHAARMSETPPFWELPAMPLGAHPPAWSAERRRS